MISISRFTFAAFLLLTLSACVTTNASRLGTATQVRPVLPAESVALYRVASQVPRQYEEIALLNSSGDSGFTDEAKMFESMKKKAGEFGANAVILDAVSEPSTGSKVAAAIFGVSAQRKGKALAIWIFPIGQAVADIVSPAQSVQPTAPPAATGQVAPAPTPQSATTGPCVSCARIGKGL